jgi:hypothetical protein
MEKGRGRERGQRLAKKLGGGSGREKEGVERDSWLEEGRGRDER